jgi:hypothetical protein
MENNKPMNQPQKRQKPSGTNKNIKPVTAGRSMSRGAAIRAQKRNQEDAHRILSQYTTVNPAENTDAKPGRANKIDDNR